MTTFTVEIHEDIVTWLKKSFCPEIVLDLPSVPELGDKLWLMSIRGTQIVETEQCTIVESYLVSRLRPTVRLVLLFGITTNHGHDAPCEQEAFSGGASMHHCQKSFEASKRSRARKCSRRSENRFLPNQCF